LQQFSVYSYVLQLFVDCPFGHFLVSILSYFTHESQRI